MIRKHNFNNALPPYKNWKPVFFFSTKKRKTCFSVNESWTRFVFRRVSIPIMLISSERKNKADSVDTSRWKRNVYIFSTTEKLWSSFSSWKRFTREKLTDFVRFAAVKEQWNACEGRRERSEKMLILGIRCIVERSIGYLYRMMQFRKIKMYY